MSESIAERNARYCLNKRGVTVIIDGRKKTKCPDCENVLGDGDFSGSLPLHDK